MAGADGAGSSKSARYEVVAVRYATRPTLKSELYYRYETYKEPDADSVMDYFYWVLRGRGETILVDTGFDPVGGGARRGRTCLRTPVDALRDLGIEPDAVSTIIVSHFHYDHIGNIQEFPQAKLIVPQKEMDFWTGPLAARYHFASHFEPDEVARIVEANRSGRVRITDGTEEILDGITAISVGGHSPGQQVTVVATAAGDVVLASDAVHYYEEFALERPFAVMADLAQMYQAYDLLKELGATPGAVVVPGHYADVVNRFPLVDASNPNAVRIA